jgi:uncharacterized protein YndB with AHSA1/START domain
MTPPWPDTFAVSTPDDTSIVIRRQFAAARDRVWQAITEPEHVRRWLGSADFPLTTCQMDVRVGGSYRWVFTRPDSGDTMGVSGRFEDVVRPERLVSIEQFDDFPGPSVNTLELAEGDVGTTAMTLTVRYADRETRDGWLTSGVTAGLGMGYERLDALLPEIV